jgi:uncharacterized alkaline shock family protein YloU
MDDYKMMNEGLTIAPGVVETIVSLAVSQVDGVAQVGAPRRPGSGLWSAIGKNHSGQGVIIMADDNGKITVAVHVQIFYGHPIKAIAEEIRSVVADTLSGQVGIETESVDVYVDGVRFPE